MYHQTSGRFDLENLSQEEALAFGETPEGCGRDGLPLHSPLTRVEVVTPTGTHVLGCSTGSTLGYIKGLLLEVLQFLEGGLPNYYTNTCYIF